VVYGAGGAAIEGLTLADTMWYLMLAEAIVLSKPNLSETISAAVRDGSVALLIGRPYNFLLYQASVGVGDTLARLGFNIVAGGTVVWLAVGPPPAPAGWPLAAVAVALGWAIDFCVTALIGLAAFVTEDVSAFRWIYSKMVLILGGVLIPLDFLPDGVRAAAMALPFAYTVYAPARLVVAPDLATFAGLVAAQLAWLAALGAVLALAYRRGVAWLTINGG
jgi:ABC-2 type transport system permease protein